MTGEEEEEKEEKMEKEKEKEKKLLRTEGQIKEVLADLKWKKIGHFLFRGEVLVCHEAFFDQKKWWLSK